MAHYLVRARLRPHQADEFVRRLEAGEFEQVRPFGTILAQALRQARRDPASGEILWEEECHCATPLAMERKSVLDDYFTDIKTAPVEPGGGWDMIEDLPRQWE